MGEKRQYRAGATFALAAALTAAAWGQGAPATAGPTLTTALAVRRLTPEVARQHVPVRLTGVVTFYDWHGPKAPPSGIFVQDRTAGIYVDPDAMSRVPRLAAGEEVTVAGVSIGGDLAPSVQATSIRVIGAARLPAAIPVSIGELAAGLEDAQWVRLTGVIRAEARTAEGWDLTLAQGWEQVTLRLPRAAAPASLVDAEVTAEGTSTTDFASDGRRTGIEVLVPTRAHLRVVTAPPKDAFAVPLETIGSLRRYLPFGAAPHRVRVAGTVTYEPATGGLVLQDATGGAYVTTTFGRQYALGTRLELVGFVRLGPEGIELTDALARRLANGAAPAPVPLNGYELAQSEVMANPFEGRLVRVRGQLLRQSEERGTRVLYLAAGQYPFEAAAPALRMKPEQAKLAPASMLELTGILWFHTSATGMPMPVIRLRSSRDIRIVSKPPWWTSARLWWVLGLLGLGVLLALAWGASLRRNLRRQHLTILRQVRERAALEEQLQQAQRLEAVGRLAGGIAHDFNNLLTVVGGRTEVLLEGARDARERRDLEAIRQATQRASGLTRQLLAYSRRQPTPTEAIELGAVAREMEGILKTLVGEAVALRITTAGEPWMVCADRGQIEQVLMNLAVNARDAMATGGTLMVAVRHEKLAAYEARRYGNLGAGDYVCLRVRDTGTGMSDDVQKHVFEPFFTTKEVGKGTGMGLAVVYGIVKQCGGGVRVESQAGEGTTFELAFPRCTAGRDACTAGEIASRAGVV